MEILLEFFRKNIHWLVFVLLEVVSLTLLFQYNNHQRTFWLSTTSTIVGAVNEWEQGMLDYLNLGATNAELSARNLILEQQNSILRHQLLSLQHDSTPLERTFSKQIDGLQLCPARIVSNSVMHKDNFLTINKGSSDGIQPEMGVVSGTGIVGIVYVVSEHYAVVMSILNSHSRISCRLRGTSYFGSLTWDGINPLYAIMDDLPRHSKIKKGAVIETSGFSSIFPPGLFMGRVTTIENSRDGQSYRVHVHLGIDMANIQDVCVVKQSFQQELNNLERLNADETK